MIETPNKTTHAQRRRDERYKEIRAKIEAAKLLKEIGADLARDIPDSELQQVKFKTDTRLRLLAKVLPDLKAMEIDAEVLHSYVAEIPAPAQTVDAWHKSLSGAPSQAPKLHS